MLFSRSKNVVGLDIGSATVKLVELREKKGGRYQLMRLGVEPLPREAIVDGSIVDSSRVVDAIRALVDRTGVKNANFATSVSGHAVIIKKIELPVMEPEELAESIQWEAERHIPFDINDVRLDYVELTSTEERKAGAVMEVLLVAVKRETVNDHVSVISRSGKSPVVVDVDAFAIQNAYELNYDLDPLKVVALVNMGAAVTNISIVARGQSVFWRDLSRGGDQFTEALQRTFSLPFDQAELLKRGESADRPPVVARRAESSHEGELGPPFPGFKVFLCHSADDQPAVRDLYRQLKRRGISTLSDSGSKTGRDGSRAIMNEIRVSHVVMVFLSHRALTKRGDIRQAVSRMLRVTEEKPAGDVIVVRLEDCKIPDRLSRWDRVDWFQEGGSESLFSRLYGGSAEEGTIRSTAGGSASGLRDILDPVSVEMAEEIRKAFDFFSATSSEGPIGEIVLSGGAALTMNLREILKERLGVPVNLLDPLRRIEIGDDDLDREWFEAIAPTLAVAVGLGIRAVGD